MTPYIVTHSFPVVASGAWHSNSKPVCITVPLTGWTGQPDWLLLIGTGDEMNRVIISNGNMQSSYKVCRQGLCHSDITVMLLFYKYYI